MLVRNVIKATQKYGDMLQFSYHLKCMSNYTEREKLFENLWSFGYQNKSAIKSEIEELLINDIPIFFNNTSKRDLISGSGFVYRNYYERTALERVVERISTFDETAFNYQQMRLELSLGIYKPKIGNIKMGTSAEENVHKIVQEIVSRANYDVKRKMVTFEDFTYNNIGTLDYDALTSELYDGLSGIYLFLLYYSQQYENEQVTELVSVLEKMLFVEPKNTDRLPKDISAYYGKYTVLYPLYHKYKLTGKDKYIVLAQKLIQGIELEKDVFEALDWLTGIAGLLKVLVNFYQVTEKSFFLEKAEFLADRIKLDQIKLCGFSHGYSGIAYALYALYQVQNQKNETYLQLIKQCLEQEDKHFDGIHWEDLREGKRTHSRWCHGTVGIGLTRLFLMKNGLKDELIKDGASKCLVDVLNSKTEEDGLCHGTMGSYWYLVEVSQSKKMTDNERDLARVRKKEILDKLMLNGVRITSFDDKPVLGLMTGIAGIGLSLLQELFSNIPNPLVLD